MCAKPPCRRARACRGDGRRCLPRQFYLSPGGVQNWFAGLAEMQRDGKPFDDAMEALNTGDEGDAMREWFEAVAKSLGEVDTMPYRWWDAR